MTKFKINGKTYTAAPFDFDLMVSLEENGVELTELEDKPLKIVKTYFAISSGLDMDNAGKEITAHIVNGGKFDAISDAMRAEMDKSDFFSKLIEGATEETEQTK